MNDKQLEQYTAIPKGAVILTLICGIALLALPLVYEFLY